MKKRKKIKQLKHEVKVLNNTSDYFFDKLIAIDLVLYPGNIDINRPSAEKRVADLVQENNRLLAQIHKDQEQKA